MVAEHNSPSLKVVAGTFRGRKLRYPQGRVLRPTMQRTKEALFSSIERLLEGCCFLDLYAGAGGVGIEALSRGAPSVHFVERSAVVAALIEENLTLCGVDPSRYEVHITPVESFLASPAFDTMENIVAFADPPYNTVYAANVLEQFERSVYPPVKLLVIEHGQPLEETDLRYLELIKSKRYGDAFLSYFMPAGDHI